MKPVFFTMSNYRQLPYAKVLLESIAAYVPDADIFLVLTERKPQESLDLGSVTVLYPEDLAVPALEQMAFQCDATEFQDGLKPYVFRSLLERGSEAVIFFDVHTRIFGSLQELLKDCAEYQAVLTSCISEPLAPGRGSFLNEDVIRAGQFNLGFLALKNGADSKAFLRYWCGAVAGHRLESLKADQFYADLIPSFVDSIRVLRSHRFHLSHWNMNQRELSVHEDTFMTRDGPLVSFQFDPKMKNSSGAPLPLLIQRYLQEVETAKQGLGSFAHNYTYAVFSDGEQITYQDRRKYKLLSSVEKRAMGDPFGSKVRIRKIQTIVGRFLDPTELKQTVGDLRTRIAAVEGSASWRLARAISWLPRQIRIACSKAGDWL